MPPGRHSLGPTCAYHEEEPDKPLSEGSPPPLVKAQFFYVSSLPIDDPLSPVPPISDKSVKHDPQPFSARDTAALEEAWQGFQAPQVSDDAERSSSSRPKSRQMFSFPRFKEGSKASKEVTSKGNLPPAYQATANDPDNMKYQNQYRKMPAKPGTQVENGPAFDVGEKEVPKISKNGSTSPLERGKATASSSADTSQVMLIQPSKQSDPKAIPVTEEELEHDLNQQPSISKKKRLHSPFHRHTKPNTNGDISSSRASTPLAAESSDTSQPPVAPDISGRPFARAPSKRNVNDSKPDSAAYVLDGADDQAFYSSDGTQDDRGSSRGRSKIPWRSSKKATAPSKPKVFVPVGVSRLHLVEVPNMMMKAIYWSPINDTSKVIRATWFYKDTMLPLPTNVANQLETGYEDIKPYLDTYQDELRACIDNGAAAEMKVVHKLWPDEPKLSRLSTGLDNNTGATDFSHDSTRINLPANPLNAAIDPDPPQDKHAYETHSVIYVDRKNAQILRPNLLPSVRQNRRPLRSIRNGRQLGVAVVRGFDRTLWQTLHPSPKLTGNSAHANVGAYMSQSGDATTRGRRKSCTLCDEEVQPSNVSDLVLVIHGIGQKLSERVDSYHFTHAINDVRRQFNVELSTEAVKGNLKQNIGMMVLPVNWRLTVSFDDDAAGKFSRDDHAKFGLKNITPDTLPAVRSIISDVMLDIPYYMSHHKQKMMSAVIREANRVYRLWCRNNPGFQEDGRVHLIAHSLGSVMAMEILGQQPTRVPDNLKIDSDEPSEKMFEFDTTNLFTCGSPAGFFLLLNNAHLLPRRGRNKPGMEGEDGTSIAGDGGYGCLAVDNIYNILHRNDPVSYLVNAAVDNSYAESLQPADIPPATASFWSRLKWVSGAGPATYDSKLPSTRPPMQSMPSIVEMDTHNFSREEIAEKRMYLLNENGQIDYFLPATGGPLEIQYLSMLSAHSSYWLSQDFIRFLVTEIGRKPGRANTIPALRAVKKREWKKGSLA